MLLPFVTTLALAAAARAQGIDVTATLDITNGLARPGAYVPVKLAVTNNTAEVFDEIRLGTGGPVEVTSAIPPLQPGETVVEMLWPAYYVGGDLSLTLDFVTAKTGRAVRVTVRPPDVRPISQDTAVVCIALGAGSVDEPSLDRIRRLLGVRQVRLLSGFLTEDWTRRCSLVDATVMPAYVEDFEGFNHGRDIILGGSPLEVQLDAPFPPSVMETVQPEAYRLFSVRSWSAEHRRNLWVCLAMFSFVVLLVGLLVPRRPRLVPAAALLAIAIGATTLIGLLGGVRAARIVEARVFYTRPVALDATGGRGTAALEHFVFLESRGGETAEYLQYVDLVTEGFSSPPYVPPLPLPVLATSDDLFKAQGTIRELACYTPVMEASRYLPNVAPIDSVKSWLKEREEGASARSYCRSMGTWIESRQPQALFHTLAREDTPYGYVPHEVREAELRKLANRSDVITALLVQGDRGKDAAGKTQSLDAWAVEWQASKDPDVAFAGRSLAWWKKARQEGDGPWILSWWHDPLPAAEASENHERLPALVVYSSAPKP